MNHHHYLFELETTDRRYVMKVAAGSDSDSARRSAMNGGSHLRMVSLIACSKTAPEYGDICKRELVE